VHRLIGEQQGPQRHSPAPQPHLHAGSSSAEYEAPMRGCSRPSDCGGRSHREIIQWCSRQHPPGRLQTGPAGGRRALAPCPPPSQPPSPRAQPPPLQAPAASMAAAASSLCRGNEGCLAHRQWRWQ
jgi:hypothetical protein